MNDSAERQPQLVANDEQTGTLLSALAQAFGLLGPSRIDIATAFLSPDGFLALERSLSGASDVRLLLGERPFLQRRGPGEVLEAGEEDADGPSEAIDWYDFLEGKIPWVLMTHEQRKRLLTAEGEEAIAARQGFDLSAWGKVSRLVGFLEKSGTQMRRYLGTHAGKVPYGEVLSRTAFPSERLHAKVYVFLGEGPVLGSVGSSNLTKGGLEGNIEVNLVTTDRPLVEELDRWFDRKWEKGQDCREEYIRLLEECVLFGRRFTPFQVFLKALHTAYGSFLGMGLGEDLAKRLSLFQQEGAARAVDLLERHWGAMVCDSVGMGKTYTGLGILAEFLKRRGNGKALVICPAQLERNWSREKLLAFGVTGETISMESMVTLVDLEEVDDQNKRREYQRRLRKLQDFDIILVDESHNFRNPGTKRYRALMEVIRGGEKPDKRVVLLTATPINNTLWDLYHQLMLITRGDNSWYVGRGPVGNLEGTFRNLEKVGGGPGLLDTMLLTLVRRTRHDIRKAQDEGKAMEINGTPLVFPTHNIPAAITYSLETLYQGFYKGIIKTVEELTFAVYNLEKYGVSRGETTEAESEEAVKRNTGFIGILKTVYLKRVESSAAAFAGSIRQQVDYLDLFLRLLAEGKALFPKDRDRLKVILGGRLGEDAFEDMDGSDRLRELWERLPKVQVPDKNRQALEADIRADREALSEMLERLAQLQVTDPDEDPKVKALRKTLEGFPVEDANGVPTKVVVFTSFKDTAEHLFRAFGGVPLNDFRKQFRLQSNLTGGQWLSVLTGDDDKKRRQDVLDRFAPLAAVRDDRDLTDPDLLEEIRPLREEGIDILIATDVLSEGQNLQDAQYLINYDLHWNPVRMIQRAGRIDRLFSPHDEVFVHNVMPEEGLNELLGLVKRLQHRVRAIDSAIGLDASVLGETIEEKAFNDIMKIRQGGSEADQVYLEGEKRQEFEDALDQLRGYIDLVKSMGTEEVGEVPDGIYSIKTGKNPGVFIMMKMPDEYGGEVFWRFYPAEGQTVETSAVTVAQSIAAERETARAELSEDQNPFVSLVEPLNRAVSEIAQEYKRRVAASDPGELVRLIRQRLVDPEIQEQEPALYSKFMRWCDDHHPADLLKREDSISDDYRRLKVASERGAIIGILSNLWTALESKGLDRPLPRPSSAEPSFKDLQLVCWELVLPEKAEGKAGGSETG